MSLFKSELVKEEEENYEKLVLAPEHRPMMEGIAKIIGQFLDLSHIALKGFIWKSLKEMQVEENITTKEIASLPAEERGTYALKAFENLKSNLYHILKTQEDKPKIDNAIDSGIKYYKENFMNR